MFACVFAFTDGTFQTRLVSRPRVGGWFGKEQSPLIMSKKMAGVIMAYGAVLAALGLAVGSVAPELAKITSITGIAGGGLCVLWGLVALAGHKRRAWTVLTLIAVLVVVLSQTVQAWMASTDKSGSVAGALLLTLMLLLTVGMLMYVLHGEHPPEFYTSEPVRRSSLPSRGNDAHSDGGRHPSK